MPAKHIVYILKSLSESKRPYIGLTHRRAEDDERVMWRGADTEARDLKSNASIATRCARSNGWLLKGLRA